MLHEHLPPAELQDAAELSQRALRVRDGTKRVDDGIGPISQNVQGRLKLEEASPAPCP